MGVPKFYRWLSERYPKINQIISDLMLMPEFDNLYLDMNGIIHHCTHPNDDDLAAALSEKDVMLGMFNYIDRIVTQIAKPRKHLFMAIDGVAPRAKLNQQRSRRFASAKDREAARVTATDRGEVVDASAVFDSNCITPGTEFMARVSAHLRYFIRKKQHEDPIWRRLHVVFSGHEVPGEGEHKIMQRIRELREDPSYDPNTTHCMYGQDADLIMLGLVSHEPHFTLLREVVNFNQQRKSPQDPKNVSKTVVKTTSTAEFQLLHVAVLREYLQMDLCRDLYLLPAQLNLERVIDDFVFMTFLVGNDFLPHLPSLDISEGAFDRLFAVYREQLMTAAQNDASANVASAYLTHNGNVPDLARLERFLAAIGQQEDEIFRERISNEAEFQARQRKFAKRSNGRGGNGNGKAVETEAEQQLREMASANAFEEAMAAQGQPVMLGGGGSSGSGSSAIAAKDRSDFQYLKAKYYFEKLGITPKHASVHEAVRKHYLEGLLWCLAYYYRGCVSWGWFYPFHYGPMMSDMVDLGNLGVSDASFHKGEPFLPFQQLLGCLPAGSKQFLPSGYQWLMTHSESPLLDFFPADFQVDMNGKRNPWEGVNLLPFIDATRMKQAIETHAPLHSLSALERERNSFGTPIEFVYDESNAEQFVASVNASIGLPDLPRCKTMARPRPDLLFDRTDVTFKAEIKPGCRLPYAGFPSLFVLPVPGAALKPIKLNCFGSDSRYSTLVLSLPQQDPDQLPPASLVAEKLLGTSVFVNWPMMHEAKVVAVSDAHSEYSLPMLRASSSSGNAPSPINLAGMGRAKAPATKGSNTSGSSAAAAALEVAGSSEEDSGAVVVRNLSADESRAWTAAAADLRDEYLKGRGTPGQGGVDIGAVGLRLSVAPLQGMQRDRATGSTSKVFALASSGSVADVPLQLAIRDNPAPDPRFLEKGPQSLADLAPLGSPAVVVADPSKWPRFLESQAAMKAAAAGGAGSAGGAGEGAKADGSGKKKDKEGDPLWPNHGRLGEVVGHHAATNTVQVRCKVHPPEPPFGLGIAAAVVDKYFPMGAVARTLKIRPDILGRLLGSLIVSAGRDEAYDLGLRLRINEPSGVKGEKGAALRVLGYIRHTGAALERQQQQQEQHAVSEGAWGSSRDAVRVIGSKPKPTANQGSIGGASGGGGASAVVGGWELSVKGVQLVAAYQAAFPEFFAALLATPPTDRTFQASNLFRGSAAANEGQGGVQGALLKVVDWLGSLEVMRLPRAPLTTEALPSDAVRAIQRAADVRLTKGAGQLLPYEVVEQVPVSALAMAPHPHTLRDVKVNFNLGLGPPLLGDRVVNVHEVGAPFGLRGTVVAIHHHSGAVECVFDEPFVGGSTLQGSCDKFRGRLLPWNHVLRVPPPPGTPGTAPPAVVIAAAPASAQTTGQAAERGGATKISTVLVGKKNAKGKSTATSAGVAAAADSKQANARPGKGKGGEVKADGKGESAPSKVSTKSKAKKGKDDEKKTEKAPEKSALFDEDDDEDEGSAAGSGGASASTTSGATAPAVAALFAAAPVAPPAGAAAPAQTKPPLYVALESTVERVSGAGASSVASPRSPTRAPPQEASARQYGVRPEDVEDAEDDVVDDEDGDGSGAIMDDDQGDVFVYDTWDTGDEEGIDSESDPGQLLLAMLQQQSSSSGGATNSEGAALLAMLLGENDNNNDSSSSGVFSSPAVSALFGSSALDGSGSQSGTTNTTTAVAVAEGADNNDNSSSSGVFSSPAVSALFGSSASDGSGSQGGTTSSTTIDETDDDNSSNSSVFSSPAVSALFNSAPSSTSSDTATANTTGTAAAAAAGEAEASTKDTAAAITSPAAPPPAAAAAAAAAPSSVSRKGAAYREAARPPSDGSIGFAARGRGRGGVIAIGSAVGSVSKGPTPVAASTPGLVGAATTANTTDSEADTNKAAAKKDSNKMEKKKASQSGCGGAQEGPESASAATITEEVAAADPLAELLAMLGAGGGGGSLATSTTNSAPSFSRPPLPPGPPLMPSRGPSPLPPPGFGFAGGSNQGGGSAAGPGMPPMGMPPYPSSAGGLPPMAMPMNYPPAGGLPPMGYPLPPPGMGYPPPPPGMGYPLPPPGMSAPGMPPQFQQPQQLQPAKGKQQQAAKHEQRRQPPPQQAAATGSSTSNKKGQGGLNMGQYAESFPDLGTAAKVAAVLPPPPPPAPPPSAPEEGKPLATATPKAVAASSAPAAAPKPKPALMVPSHIMMQKK